MTVDIGDAWDKLGWAENHFEALRRQIEPFTEHDTHTLSFDVDPDSGKYMFFVHGLNPPDPNWGLMIGDCVHNARTALDYLMVRLVAMVKGEDPARIDSVQFPIYDDPAKLANRVGGLRKELEFSGYLARIEELQPYNALNPSIWGRDPSGKPVISIVPYALKRLSELDNVDKHRVIHAAWIGVDFLSSQQPEIPENFKLIDAGIKSRPLVGGAEVGYLTFQPPLPGEWNPSQVDMKRCFPIHVAFDEAQVPQGVLEVLWFCIEGVRATLKLFDPVFAHLAAPLPVATTVPSQIEAASTKKG